MRHALLAGKPGRGMTAQAPRGAKLDPDCRSSSITLDDASIDAIARRVVELLHGEQATDLVDAATLARVLGVSRGYVYEHVDRLGGVRLGDGPKARLRFDVEKARAAKASGTSSRRATAAQSRTATEKPRGRRRARLGTSVALLPIEPSPPAEREAP